jgi:uncharacterized protein involved in type VI secretion and phage assembly
MRVAQSYGGSGKGNYFRPEIGEEVQVSFEGSNTDCPYVSACFYNGMEKPDFFDPKNLIKGLKMKFGQMLKFVEKSGIWLSDPSGNEIHLDEENKNINTTTPETFTIRAKNIVFEATESITVKAGTNILETAGINKTLQVGGILDTQVIGSNLLHVKGDFHEQIDGDLHSETKQDRNTISHSDFTSLSQENAEFHSKNDIQNNSTEDTTQN